MWAQLIITRLKSGKEGDLPRLIAARATMEEIFDGAPEFVDLIVVDEMSG
jgi:hypothetical protein